MLGRFWVIVLVVLAWSPPILASVLDLSGDEWNIESSNGTRLKSGLPVYALEALTSSGGVADPLYRC